MTRLRRLGAPAGGAARDRLHLPPGAPFVSVETGDAQVEITRHPASLEGRE